MIADAVHTASSGWFPLVWYVGLIVVLLLLAIITSRWLGDR